MGNIVYSLFNKTLKQNIMEQEVMRDEPQVMEERPRMKEYRPSRVEMLREYELRVRFLSVGCIVSVGCKEIAFGSIDEAMEKINEYVKSPYESSQKWREIFDQNI